MVIFYSTNAKPTEDQVKVEVQDIPRTSISDVISKVDEVVPEVKKPTEDDKTTPKSVIIETLLKTGDSTSTATVQPSTTTIETTTEEQEEDDDDYANPDGDSGISCALVATICGGK